MILLRNILSYLIDPLDSIDEILTTLCNKSITAVIAYMRSAAGLNIFVHTWVKIDNCFYIAATISGTDASMSMLSFKHKT